MLVVLVVGSEYVSIRLACVPVPGDMVCDVAGDKVYEILTPAERMLFSLPDLGDPPVAMMMARVIKGDARALFLEVKKKIK